MPKRPCLDHKKGNIIVPVILMVVIVLTVVGVSYFNKIPGIFDFRGHAQSSEVKSVRIISKIFGNSNKWTTAAKIPVINGNYYGIQGTDLGAFTRYKGKLWFDLGDTRFYNSDHNTNFLVAYSSDTNLTDGVTMDGFLNVVGGVPRQDLSNAEGYTAITNSLFTINWGGKEYMFSQYMYPIEMSGNDHHVHYAQIAKFNDSSKKFSAYKPNVYHWPGSWRHFDMASFWVDYPNGYLYMVGSPSGRFGGVKLARIPLASFMDGYNTDGWQYYLGNLQWSPSTKDQQVIKSAAWLIPPKYSGWTPEMEVEPGYKNTLNWDWNTQCQNMTIAEFSVVFNPYLNKFILMTSLPCDQGGIYYYTSDNIWGPWSDAKLLLPVTHEGGFNWSFYGIYTSNGLWENNGETMYFTGSNWGTDASPDYGIYWFKVDWSNIPITSTPTSTPTLSAQQTDTPEPSLTPLPRDFPLLPAGLHQCNPDMTDTCPSNQCLTVYRDADGDGYGLLTDAKDMCETGSMAGYVTNSLDCADNNPDVHPNSTVCSSQSFTDNNGQTSWDYDCSGGLGKPCGVSYNYSCSVTTLKNLYCSNKRCSSKDIPGYSKSTTPAACGTNSCQCSKTSQRSSQCNDSGNTSCSIKAHSSYCSQVTTGLQTCN